MTSDTASSLLIGDFIRQRRQANGLTQRELGELAGVGTRFISEVERGKSTVRLDVVDQVLAVFGKRLGVIERPIEAPVDRTHDSPGASESAASLGASLAVSSVLTAATDPSVPESVVGDSS